MPYQKTVQKAVESNGLMEKCGELKNRDVLLLEGEKSYGWLKETVKTLAAILPEAQHTELKKCVHNSADNSENPEIVAEALKKFF